MLLINMVHNRRKKKKKIAITISVQALLLILSPMIVSEEGIFFLANKIKIAPDTKATSSSQ